MKTVCLADAKAHLSRLIEMVEAGEEITITKRGKPVVRPVANAPAPQLLPGLAELRSHQSQMQVPAGEFIRKMREGDRY